MKHLRKISDYAVIGGLGALVATGLQGCGETQESTKESTSKQSMSDIKQKAGALVIIEEQPGGGYKILEEHPSETTRIVLKDPNGAERMLSQEEVDKLIKDEATKIEQGTSNLTSGSGGLSLGETILASAAGAILGSWIGSKLFNNQNYQAQQRTTYKSPQAYERSQSSFNKTATSGSSSTTRATGSTPSSAKGGFFNPSQGASGAATTQSSSSQSSSKNQNYGG